MKTQLPKVVLVVVSALLARSAAASPAAGQAPQGLAASSRTLCGAQDEGELRVSDVVEALAGEDAFVASTAAAIVRHEWRDLPGEFFAALNKSPVAARRFLEELVIAPRPSAAAWAALQMQPGQQRSLSHRLMALVARRQPVTKVEAQLLLEAARAGELGDGYYQAAALLSEKVANSLIGRIHQGLAQGDLVVGDLGPLLDRLSPRGTRSLLGLAVTLPPDTSRRLLRQIYESRPSQVQDRVAASLDGKIPLDPLWLEFGQGLLSGKARVDRVVDLLVATDSASVRERAFDLLLSEGCLDQRALLAIKESGSERDIRRLIGRGSNQLPSRFVLDLLEASPEVSEVMARALATRKPLEPEIQRHLLQMLDGLGSADSHTPLHAVTAIVHGGDAESLNAVWPLVKGSFAWRDLFYRMGRRTEPYVYELMLAELSRHADPGTQAVSEPLDSEQLDMLRLLLVARGDRRELDQLIANAPKRRANFVRRCRQYAGALEAAQANALIDAAVRCADAEVAMELVEWSAATKDAAVADRLWDLWKNPPEIEAIEEVQEALMRVLAAGPRRTDLVVEMRAVIAQRPLPEHMSSLSYELLNTMPKPLDAASVEVCAELLLKLPLVDGEGEADRARRWSDGTSGFPLVAAVANSLRGVDAALAVQVFGALVDDIRVDRRRVRISRQRLKVFWRTLSFDADLQLALGRITSRLWGFHEGGEGVTEGPAMWLQARDYEHLGDYAQAEQWYRRAGRQLFRTPSMRREARWLLGERNPAAGEDPLAALAAAPFRMQLLRAKEAGDAAVVARAANLLREFAGYDRETLDTVKDIPTNTGR